MITLFAMIGVSAANVTSDSDRTCAMPMPHKGDRRKTTLRLPIEIANAAQSHVDAFGGSLNDLVVELLAQKLAAQLATDSDELTTEEVPQTAA